MQDYNEKLHSLEDEIVNEIQNKGVYKSRYLPSFYGQVVCAKHNKRTTPQLTLSDLTENFTIDEWDSTHKYLVESMKGGAIDADTIDTYYNALYRVVRDYFAETIVKNEIREKGEI